MARRPSIRSLEETRSADRKGDGPTVKAWTEQMLAPKLQPGDIVIMDNLPVHKVQGVRQAIEAKGAQLRYLPPYSPDLNPSNVSRRSIRSLKGTRSGDRGGRKRLCQAQRHCFARPPSEPPKLCGPPSASCSTASRPPNAKTISRMLTGNFSRFLFETRRDSHFLVVLARRRVMAWRSGHSYSADLRERVLAAVDGGLPATAVAGRFDVSLSFICKALK